jgi:chorismate synthase
MSGNTIGRIFRITTAGESHGSAYIVIVDGCPPGLDLSEADIQPELDRRKPGSSSFTTQRREDDRAKILSGVFEGKTTGTPIAMLIENEAQRPRDYQAIKDLFRPGHGDFTYQHKYGLRDYRGGGRASARETMLWVAAGAIAKKYLRETFQTKIQAYLAQMGEIKPTVIDLSVVERNPFFFPDLQQIPQLEACIEQLRRDGDSIGARVNVIASGVPIGLGAPVFDRLDGDIAKWMMDINAVKGVEIGDGFEVIRQKGSHHRDQMTPQGFLSNHAGGVLAGISTGQDITVSIALKPASSIITPAKTVTINHQAADIVTKGRHDPCVGIRAVPIAEAVLALVLMDHVLLHRGQCGV